MGVRALPSWPPQGPGLCWGAAAWLSEAPHGDTVCRLEKLVQVELKSEFLRKGKQLIFQKLRISLPRKDPGLVGSKAHSLETLF